MTISSEQINAMRAGVEEACAILSLKPESFRLRFHNSTPDFITVAATNGPEGYALYFTVQDLETWGKESFCYLGRAIVERVNAATRNAD